MRSIWQKGAWCMVHPKRKEWKQKTAATKELMTNNWQKVKEAMKRCREMFDALFFVSRVCVCMCLVSGFGCVRVLRMKLWLLFCDKKNDVLCTKSSFTFLFFFFALAKCSLLCAHQCSLRHEHFIERFDVHTVNEFWQNVNVKEPLPNVLRTNERKPSGKQ